MPVCIIELGWVFFGTHVGDWIKSSFFSSPTIPANALTAKPITAFFCWSCSRWLDIHSGRTSDLPYAHCALWIRNNFGVEGTGDWLKNPPYYNFCLFNRSNQQHAPTQILQKFQLPTTETFLWTIS